MTKKVPTIDDYSHYINKEAVRIEGLRQALVFLRDRNRGKSDDVEAALIASLEAEFACSEHDLREQVKIWMGRAKR